MRSGQLVAARADTVLRSGDGLFLVVDDADDEIMRCFRAQAA